VHHSKCRAVRVTLSTRNERRRWPFERVSPVQSAGTKSFLASIRTASRNFTVRTPAQFHRGRRLRHGDRQSCSRAAVSSCPRQRGRPRGGVPRESLRATAVINGGLGFSSSRLPRRLHRRDENVFGQEPLRALPRDQLSAYEHAGFWQAAYRHAARERASRRAVGRPADKLEGLS